MKNSRTVIMVPLILINFMISSCKEKKKDIQSEAENDKITETTISEEKEVQTITLEKLQGSPAYVDAVLQMDIPKTGKLRGGVTDFEFTVNNYELGAQTGGPNARALANSGKGQHIHFILNNEPYSAHYEHVFKKEIPNGVHHLVAFLSRSYHESVKNENSVVVKKIEVGTDAEDTIGIDVEAPTLIYSRPKGEYSGKDAENLLLDFFILNTTLSENGTKVRATINGKEFMITEWVPYKIRGLSKGKVIIQLELIDSKGIRIDGPFNKVTRTVMIK